MVEELLREVLGALTDNGAEPIPGFGYPYVRAGRFVRVPPYRDEYYGIGGATALVRRDGTIRVRPAFGRRRTFRDPAEAGSYLAEV